MKWRSFASSGPDPLDHDVALEAFDTLGATEENICHSTRREVLEDRVPTELRYSHGREY